MQSLAQRVLSHIRRQESLQAGDRVGVAVSGGLDSVALLRLMLELRGDLGIVLTVVHFNHKLRGAESDADERFVANLAREHDLQFFVDGDDAAEHAREERVSLETAARELRYEFFRHLIGDDRDGDPQGLKPDSPAPSGGTTEVVPIPVSIGLDKILTGHTLDDQAETVLMRMIRGAGLKGLGGIYPRIAVEDDDGEICGEIVRPLLAFRRRELEQYLKVIGQPWREDSTNAESHFTRNRVRHLVVPLLEKEFNPSVAENLAELADIARGEVDYWENEVAGWMGTGVHWWEPQWARREPSDLVQIAAFGEGLAKTPTSRAKSAREMEHPATSEQEVQPDDTSLSLEARITEAPWLVMNATIDRLWFMGEPIAVQRRLLRAIAEEARFPLEFKHVDEILRFAEDPQSAGKELSLPLGWKLTCTPEEIIFVTPDLRKAKQAEEYEYALAVPGTTFVNELGSTFEVQHVAAPDGTVSEQLLDAESIGPLKIRNWRAGDRFWPAHTKAPKKIKELLQERQVPQAERRLWPVVESSSEIVWVRGLPVPAKFRATPGKPAIRITEISYSESQPT